jgi:CMP-N,N'-diacetyllegionaminic acid synthase
MILASICCRGGSMRVPNKALRVVGGMTLLERKIKQAKRVFTRVIVSTDSPEIGRPAWELGAEVLRRPPHLATSDASKWDVFRHLVDEKTCDTLVDLDISCPFVDDEDIRRCVDKLIKTPNYDVVATAYEPERNPYFNMVENPFTGGGLQYWKRVCTSNVANSAEAPEVYALSPAVFAIQTPALFAYDHWSQAAMGILVIPRARGFDIDTEFDLKVAQLLEAE